ncbi:MAG: NYN domain-containing protein, partial [Lachnospiraceae bacterium]|nr:NYN domain-containing protein [Lachnospiraceae bacterium]
SPVTDIKFTLVTGKAHIKHTEGGDFRQATYRAVRNGLMQAQSKLLEPYYDFLLEIPSEYVGRAMMDLELRFAKDFVPEIDGDVAILRGNAPVSTLSGYGSEVIAYTGGLGRLSFSVRGYGDCHNEEEVIEKIGYDPERDVRNSGDSVFCSHGSGVIVPWNEVKQHMHMPSYLNPTKELTDEQIRMRAKRQVSETVSQFISPDEVDAIIKSASSANKKETFIPHKGINHKTHVVKREAEETTYRAPVKGSIKPEYLLIDGYNVIYAWKDLKEIANVNIDGARSALLDILSDYQAMKGMELIAVFDAYKLVNHKEEYIDYNNIHVVFTRTAQTADYYIERFTKENRSKYRIRVVTSDGLEQVIVRGENTLVTSSREFYDEVQSVTEEFRKKHGVT